MRTNLLSDQTIVKTNCPQGSNLLNDYLTDATKRITVNFCSKAYYSPRPYEYTLKWINYTGANDTGVVTISYWKYESSTQGVNTIVIRGNYPYYGSAAQMKGIQSIRIQNLSINEFS